MPDQSTLALEHYTALGDVSTLMQRDLSQVWQSIAGDTPTAAVAALLEAVPGIGEMYGDMAATLAVDYYESSREIAGVPGSFVAKPAVLAGPDRFDSLVRWAVTPLFDPTQGLASVPTRIGGPLQMIVADASRETIVGNSERDPKAVGWKRVTHGGCDFCQMLAGRSTLYRAGSRFASHPHCHCSGAPVFGDGTTGQHVSVNQYEASKRNITDADRARLRAYMKKQRAN